VPAITKGSALTVPLPYRQFTTGCSASFTTVAVFLAGACSSMYSLLPVGGTAGIAPALSGLILLVQTVQLQDH
jgi:hypothetical protein